ncbi:protein of unknown function DUF192 [Thioalkalivibrio nitratireducens DSM 14787]|uniref:DUF192 domain-containing protein n=1 Tax=Thioalkalivibrio nitratireducens (strain DSM 14787 / UNIQEM 213 / ALEN2) TaxID=1255043 RepID=L0DRE3_THIND|nr:DUF192 domain-containing protein [Thioalkalivibrio nitratireducens]AGA32159.1 protein of unknown function DUF192 [Thioalkalivibrio nitratireducens DSM 14787]
MSAPGAGIPRWFAACTAAVVLLVAVASTATGLPVAELRLADRTLTVEIAATPETMSRGLMFREHLPEDHGMLFVWPADQVVAMWMKNTFVPLSVAFLDRDFRILNIADMEPRSLRPHRSHGRARYALEVNQGWFERHGLGPGDRIGDLERVLQRLSDERR